MALRQNPTTKQAAGAALLDVPICSLKDITVQNVASERLQRLMHVQIVGLNLSPLIISPKISSVSNGSII